MRDIVYLVSGDVDFVPVHNSVNSFDYVIKHGVALGVDPLHLAMSQEMVGFRCVHYFVT